MTQLEIAIKALEEIRNLQGKVCETYEICEHVSCSSSYASWAIADEALRHLTQREPDSLNADPISRTWDTPEEDEAWRIYSGLRKPLGGSRSMRNKRKAKWNR